MPTVERPFSDLLREPKSVVSELADHDVHLRRRNAPMLRLSRVDREEDRALAVDALSRLLRNLARNNPTALGEVLNEALPWVTFLPGADRLRLVDELTGTLAASAALDSFAPVAQLLREWRATAAIHADPPLSRRLRKSLVARGTAVPRSSG